MHPKWPRNTRTTAKNCRMESWEDGNAEKKIFKEASLPSPFTQCRLWCQIYMSNSFIPISLFFVFLDFFVSCHW